MLEFDVPIDFVAARTAIIHGLASWFDLDFEAHESAKSPEPESEQDSIDQVAWEYPVAASTWPWMAAEPPLNPGPTPEPPRKGVKVTLSTGPNGELKDNKS
jgi:histone-arginine methyltransferase CARM1